MGFNRFPIILLTCQEDIVRSLFILSFKIYANSSSLLKNNLKIYLFFAVLGLCCCTDFSLVAVSGDYFLSGDEQAPHCCGFSCCGAWALEHSGFSSCGSLAPECNSCNVQAWLLHCMWDLPQLGIKPLSPALAGRVFTPEPLGKPLSICFSSSSNGNFLH